MSYYAQEQVSLAVQQAEQIALKAQRRAQEAFQRQQQAIREIQQLQTSSANLLAAAQSKAQALHQRVQQGGQQAQALRAELHTLQTQSQHLSEMAHACKQQLERTHQETKQIEAGLEQLNSAAKFEQRLLKAAIHQGREAESDATNTAGQVAKTTGQLVDETLKGQQILKQMGSALDQLQTASAELMLLASNPELTVPSMLTLQAMDEQGYHVRQTNSTEELTVYFESRERDHYFAVKHQKIPSTPASRQWALASETYQLVGDVCSDILDDFESSLEQMGAEIVPGTRYVKNFSPDPKPDGVLIQPPDVSNLTYMETPKTMQTVTREKQYGRL